MKTMMMQNMLIPHYYKNIGHQPKENLADQIRGKRQYLNRWKTDFPNMIFSTETKNPNYLQHHKDIISTLDYMSS